MCRVTLYSKPCCHLCDDVKIVINRVRALIPFEFETRNILDRAADFAEYQFAIPVIHVDGREIARYRLSADELIAALQTASESDRA